MPFNEDSRVKIPALIHFTRSGYDYLSLKGANWDESSNIFPELFHDALRRINPDPNPDELEKDYAQKVSPISTQQQKLENQNQELTELRDWLLPMLMNGQVSVN